MVSGYPISTNLLWIDGLSTDPRDFRASHDEKTRVLPSPTTPDGF